MACIIFCTSVEDAVPLAATDDDMAWLVENVLGVWRRERGWKNDVMLDLPRPRHASNGDS